MFWLERAPWPFVHAVVPLGLYFVTRNLALSLLLLYFWETVETVLALSFNFFVEDKTDSLVGDPLMGAAAIFGFYLLDLACGWRKPFLASVSPWLRFAAFALIGGASALVLIDGDGVDESKAINLGLLLFGLVYIALALAFFNRIAFRGGSADEVRAGRSVFALVGTVAALLLVATPRFANGSGLSSVFLRVIVPVAGILLVAIDLYIVKTR